MTHPGMVGAVLYAKDLGRLAQFYSTVTGGKPQMAEKGFVVLGSEPSQFVIVSIPRRIADSIDIATAPGLREDTPIKLLFAVEGIARARESAAALGGAINDTKREWQFEGATVAMVMILKATSSRSGNELSA